MMNVMNYDLSNAGCAAFVSSEEDGRARWSELSVWFDPSLGRPWIAEARGRSARDGERDKVRRLASANLEKALGLFDDTDMGVIVKTNAREWAEERGVPQSPPRFTPTSYREAVAILMGCTVDEISASAVGKALGIGESSVRMALQQGRELRVPLAAVFPFIDRAAFQRARLPQEVQDDAEG